MPNKLFRPGVDPTNMTRSLLVFLRGMQIRWSKKYVGGFETGKSSPIAKPWRVEFGAMRFRNGHAEPHSWNYDRRISCWFSPHYFGLKDGPDIPIWWRELNHCENYVVGWPNMRSRSEWRFKFVMAVDERSLDKHLGGHILRGPLVLVTFVKNLLSRYI